MSAIYRRRVDDDREPQDAESQEERALRALQAVWQGGDLTDETTRLSNEFTDRHTARIGDWFRRVLGRKAGH